MKLSASGPIAATGPLFVAEAKPMRKQKTKHFHAIDVIPWK